MSFRLNVQVGSAPDYRPNETARPAIDIVVRGSVDNVHERNDAPSRGRIRREYDSVYTQRDGRTPARLGSATLPNYYPVRRFDHGAINLPNASEPVSLFFVRQLAFVIFNAELCDSSSSSSSSTCSRYNRNVAPPEISTRHLRRRRRRRKFRLEKRTFFFFGRSAEILPIFFRRSKY